MKTIRDAEKALQQKRLRVAHWERFRAVPDDGFYDGLTGDEFLDETEVDED